ncbi:spore germination protein [Cohnella soli]|uniref:Spore germination protein n=1 Tax=Cohnella soli TaxID=425005 RepID=A0ABW0I2E8_9BACL
MGENLSKNLDENRTLLEQQLSQRADIVSRDLGGASDRKICVVYAQATVDHNLLGRCLTRLAEEIPEAFADLQRSETFGKLERAGTLEELTQGVLSGKAALLFGNGEAALVTGIEQWPTRSIQEPDAEPLVRGPREGFIEQLDSNLAMLSNRIRTQDLKIETILLGKYTQTKVAMVYIDGVAKKSVVEEVRSRMTDISIDGIIDSSYVEAFIEDEPYSPFPTIQNTERPDVTAAGLLEGRVAILAQGSPSAIVMPFTFWGSLQSAQDYYENWIVSTFVRWLRLVFMVISLFFPSIYIAISTFHPEMIPTNLLVSIAGAREANPFPAFVEALIMEVSFEALREAGVRLPKQVGAAVSIVGALVIGQAAVEAGIVSAPMVIVVAITGIASFTVPRFNFSFGLRLLRFPMMFLAGAFGLFGIAIGFLALLVHLCSLRSFGVPYLYPVAPLSTHSLKDVFIRVPHWAFSKREKPFDRRNPVRVPGGQKPRPNRS